MRCRKVRSLLSAISFKDDIATRLQAKVREHLSTCSSCRREAAYYDSIHEAGSQVTSLSVSDDFNNSLLNRLANERFLETRTKAHMPSPAPRFSWRVLTPVITTAALILTVTANVFITSNKTSNAIPVAANSALLDNSYQTAQPLQNPNMTVSLQKRWTLNDRIAQAERLQRISRMLITPSGFGYSHLTSGRRILPGSSNRYQPLPSINTPVGFNSGKRVFHVTGSNRTGDDDRIY